ncbi:MAG: hypothetical protein ACH349_01400 [Candidatus Rhabdochlamydia sp.]
MKISVDDIELFTLSETQKQVIKNDIHEDIFDEDMKRRLHWVLNHKYERCLERLKKQWIPKLIRSGVEILSMNDDDFATLVFSHPDYQDRKSRDMLNPGI